MAKSYAGGFQRGTVRCRYCEKPPCRKPTTATAHFQDDARSVPEGLLFSKFVPRSSPSASGPVPIGFLRRKRPSD